MLDAADVGYVDVLSEIPKEDRSAVLAQCVIKHHKTGRMIWREGDNPQFIAFIKEGKAISMYHARNGRVGATGIWAAGDILGGSSIYQPRQRLTTVKCLERTVIYCLNLHRAREITQRFPEVGRAIINALSARIKWANHLTHILQTLSAFERVGSILISLSGRFAKRTEEGIVIDVSLSHEEVAALVGVTRQFATITLHELQDRGLIYLRRRTVIVRDMKRLRKLIPDQ